MSSAFRQLSHGIAGLTGAPRPALVTCAGGVSGREHDINMATDSAANAARPTFARGNRDIGADHTFSPRCVTITHLEDIRARSPDSHVPRHVVAGRHCSDSSRAGPRHAEAGHDAEAAAALQ